MTTVTKDELTQMVSSSAAASAVEAVEAYMKERRKADKKAARAEAEKAEAEKNANNGGDISEADIKPTSSADADDVNAIPDGGSVDPQYVNKSEAEDGSLVKQVADQLEELTKEIGSVKETVAKIAKRPRPGGPSLDGQIRVPDEGRQGEAAKSEADGVIEQLEKSLEDATDPVAKERIGERLSIERLTRFYQARGLPR
jgi:hypothetical protein